MKILEMGQLGDLSPQGSIAIGVIVGLISTSLQAIGLTLQRKSHILEDEKYPYDLRRPPYRRTRWQIGMFMFVLANIVGSTIQITTLPLPVLSTLQAAGLVFNTIFATLILGESFTRYSFFGTALVCIGAILIAIFGAIGEPAHNLDQLLELLGRAAFLRWMVGTGVVVALTLLGTRMLKVPPVPGRSSTWGLPKSSISLSSHQHHAHHHHHSPRLKIFRGLMYGAVSGILSAHSLLVAKSAVELVVRTILDRANQFNRWQSWIILLGLVTLALVQLYYMHRGLKLCSTSILYPFVFCIYNIIAILDGLIYFRQVSRLSGLHAGLIALGTVILLSGVLCLSWRLEETPAQAEAGAAASALAPGLGLLEEQAETPEYSDYNYPSDEESFPTERQPLLQTPNQPRSPSTLYTSSLPRSSTRHRHSINLTNETAQIWADLYDENNTATATTPTRSKSSASPASLPHTTRNRRSTSSGIPSSTGDIQTPSSPLAGRDRSIRWKPTFKHSPSSRSRQQRRRSILRRASTPVVAEEHAHEQGTVQRDVGASGSADGSTSGSVIEGPRLSSDSFIRDDGTPVLESNGAGRDNNGRLSWFGRLFRGRR